MINKSTAGKIVLNVVGVIPLIGTGVGIGRIVYGGRKIYKMRKEDPSVTKTTALYHHKTHFNKGISECVPIIGPTVYWSIRGIKSACRALSALVKKIQRYRDEARVEPPAHDRKKIGRQEVSKNQTKKLPATPASDRPVKKTTVAQPPPAPHRSKKTPAQQNPPRLPPVSKAAALPQNTKKSSHPANKKNIKRAPPPPVSTHSRPVSSFKTPKLSVEEQENQFQVALNDIFPLGPPQGLNEPTVNTLGTVRLEGINQFEKREGSLGCTFFSFEAVKLLCPLSHRQQFATYFNEASAGLYDAQFKLMQLQNLAIDRGNLLRDQLISFDIIENNSADPDLVRDHYPGMHLECEFVQGGPGFYGTERMFYEATLTQVGKIIKTPENPGDTNYAIVVADGQTFSFIRLNDEQAILFDSHRSQIQVVNQEQATAYICFTILKLNPSLKSPIRNDKIFLPQVDFYHGMYQEGEGAFVPPQKEELS